MLCQRNLLEEISRLITILQLDVNGLVLGDHFMVELPSSALAQLGNHDITIAKQVHIEVDM